MGVNDKIIKKFWMLLVMIILIGVALATTARADLLVTDLDPPDTSPNADDTSDKNPQWVHPSDPATEEAWLEGLLGGVDVYYYGKDEDNTWNDGAWNEGDSSSDWIYAVLKYGVGQPSIDNPDHWAIHDNDGDHIVDLGLAVLPTQGLSHISYFGAAPVPEPATMLLFGAGLTGLGMFRKKFRK